MQTIIQWLNEKFAPKVNVITQNIWVRALQRTMISTLPIILVGSVLNIINSLGVYLTFMPDLSKIYYYTFYLLGLFVSIMIPYYVIEGKRLRRIQLVTVVSSVGVFLMTQVWNLNPYGETPIAFTNLGPQGIVLAIICGYFVSFVMTKFANFSFFKKDTSMPEFVTSWFNQMLPIFLCFVIPYIIVYVVGFNLLQVINEVFAPIAAISNTLPGFMLINFLYVFFYSIGASGWILSGAFYPILLTNIAANAALVANGQAPTAIATNEVIYAGWCTLGGLGCTLPLVILMLKSKSIRLRGLAKGTLIPSICNINEPIVYGAPIVLNPILMIPMWLNALIVPVLVYFALTGGMVAIPAKAFNMGFIPYGISTYLVNFDFRGLILLVLVFAITLLIWFPFFKVFEAQEVKKDEQGKVEA